MSELVKLTVAVGGDKSLDFWRQGDDGILRIMDLDMATLAGLARPTNVRQLIERKMGVLKEFGEVCTKLVQTHPSAAGGRPSKATYYLNREQMHYLLTQFNTPAGVAATVLIVRGFSLLEKMMSTPAPAPAAPQIDAVAIEQIVVQVLGKLGRTAATDQFGLLGEARAERIKSTLRQFADMQAPGIRNARAWRSCRGKQEAHLRKLVQYLGAWHRMPDRHWGDVNAALGILGAQIEDMRRARGKSAQLKLVVG